MLKGNFKGTKEYLHKYISHYYSNEFESKRDEKLTIVEIGVRDGFDLALFSDWFHKSKVFGIDIEPIKRNLSGTFNRAFGDGAYYKGPCTFKNFEFILGNAYDNSTLLRFKDNSIDYLIDDGSHILADQIKCIEKYLPKIKIGGKIIIEDVGCNEAPADTNPSIENCIHQIVHKVESYKKHKWRIIDLRSKTNSKFSVIVEIEKRQ